VWWDKGKEQIKSFSRQYSAKKHRESLRELKDRRKKLRNAQRKADLTGDACHICVASELREHVRALEIKFAEGAKIRSKATHVEHNETCSKYFFNLEKKHGEDKIIRAVKSLSGDLFSEPAMVRAEIRNFYQKLYSVEPCDSSAQNTLLSNVDKQVSEEQNEEILPDIIAPDQTCSVPNRSISTNGLLLRDLIQIADECNIPAALISLDQLKAFDRVNWDFLFKSMKAFNIDPVFVSWVKLLYTDISSCVKVNGHLMDSFELSRGVRQGCPLSPLLYTIVAETFATAICKNPEIHGIPISSSIHNKISQYADDTTLTVVGGWSVTQVFRTVTLYERASGARINLDKCTGLWIGTNKSRTDQLEQIKWTNDKVKIIGHVFGNVDTSHDNWDDRVLKFRKTLNLWKSRDLSLKGKVLIANQLAASKLWYPASIHLLPDWAEKQINESLWDFFNSGHPQQVKRQICELPRHLGGQAVINITQKIRALQVMWIVHLLHAPEANWKFCVLYNFNKYQNLRLGIDILNARVRKNDLRVLPKFYQQVLDTWFRLQGKRTTSPQTRGDVMREPILYNRNVVNQVTGLPLTMTELTKAGIIRFEDLSYVVVPGLLPLAAFRELVVKHLPFTKTERIYETIRNSLPRDWLHLINHNSQSIPSPDRDTFAITPPGGVFLFLLIS